MTDRIDLHRARAHWLTRDLLGLPERVLPEGIAAEELRWSLAVAPDGGLDPHAPAAEELDLRLSDGALPHPVADANPHLAACYPLHLAPADAARAEELLTGQVALLGRRPDGALEVATSLQVARVLDDLYARQATAGTYGPSWAAGADGLRLPTVTVWAPTARQVDLLLWDEMPPAEDRGWSPPGEPVVVPMARHDDGAWRVSGPAGWRNRCYLFELVHVLPRTGLRRTVRSTDPWSVGLTIGSTHSVLLDLDDPAWAPEGWRSAPAPAPLRAVDQTIYELHVRDFSRDDSTVPEDLRGSYLAFGHDGAGSRHLRELGEAGMTSVHLLPVFDFSSVEEDPAERAEADPGELARLSQEAPAGTGQQELVRATARRDAFNWGYDPWHVLVPEGSYTTTAADAHGGRRVAQCRQMVGALHGSGLRVVLDQVYNHTTDSGLGPASVLDRVVPGYYHRLDGEGWVDTSTCCQNLATEHAMGEKLMVDGCVLWVRHYRVDGFRFDLMGHHSRANLEAVRAALDGLTTEVDGVDGRAVHLYGEGWSFGEVAGNARFYQAVQGQLGGTGIGTFNDRLRDAVRGGTVHVDDPRADRGFATGGSDPAHTDLLQVGLAGGLREITFRSQRTGDQVTGDQVPYGAAPGGYATAPEDVVNYVDAHDNETLWDTLVLKLDPGTTMARRLRHNTLALAAVTLSQGISFWHAGAELLRSKSLDRNSYDSGDWFNRYDVTGQDNGFGRGLPPGPDNEGRWGLMAPLLADPALRPTAADVALARDCALDLLRLRRDLPLLRLGTAQRIRDKVSFPVSGTGQGRAEVVAMLVDDEAGQERVDPACSGVLVVLNAATDQVRLELPGLRGQAWQLARAQRHGADPVVKEAVWDVAEGAVTVPGLTAAVLVRPR